MAKKILVIDDEPNFVQALFIRLESFGFEVIGALDGKSGVEKAKKEKPDLILLDLDMPVMNGFETAKNLASEPLTACIPIVVLTCMVNLDLKKTVPETNAAGFLLKPVENGTLLNVINLVLEKNNSPENKS